MKRSYLRRRKPLERNQAIKKQRSEKLARSRRRTYLKAGPRMKAWNNAWRLLKREFEKRDITRCEFDFIPHVCDGTVTPAHSKKRRKMEGDDIYQVALACLPVHRILDEKMTHEAMEEAVLGAISRRGAITFERARKIA